MTGLTGLLIPASQSQPVATVEIVGDQLQQLQIAVGGYIEFVPCGRLQLVVNEEGILKGLPVNQRATALWWTCQDARSDQFLAGDVFLVGPATKTGETRSLDVGSIKRITAALDGSVDFDSVVEVAC